ncbi:HAMP domain-containing sensor histidine kinase [Gordoniibacillus kamchatkensis]
MKTLCALLSKLPIKWKIMLWSTGIMCILFAVYNAAQFITLGQWLNNQERVSMQKSMAQIQEYYQEKKTVLDVDQVRNSKSYLEKIIERRQLIRILDQNGLQIIAVSNRLPDDWVPPEESYQSLFISVWHDNEHLLVLRSPIHTDHFQGTVEIVNNLETLDQISNIILVVMVIAGLGAIFFSGFGGFLLSKQLLHPIQSLVETIQNIKVKGLQERVRPMNNNDELSRLAHHFNDMMDQLETSFQQQKQFVEDASHELRTPLAIMKGHLSLLKRWGKNDPQVLEVSLDAAIQEFQRMEGIVQELLELTRSESDHPEALIEIVKPSAFVQQCVERFSSAHPNMVFETDLHFTESDAIEVVPYQLEQVLVILLDNAVKYSADNNVVRINGMKQNHFVKIRVTDSGIGIPSDELPYVFDRFYRVDKARSREGGGTGIGLAIAKRLVERNRGKITIMSKEHYGTTVTVSIPACSKTE